MKLEVRVEADEDLLRNDRHCLLVRVLKALLWRDAGLREVGVVEDLLLGEVLQVIADVQVLWRVDPLDELRLEVVWKNVIVKWKKHL